MKNWVLITGASSGIGEALAKEYAQKNCGLLLVARRADRLEQVKKSCGSCEVELLVADVTAENFSAELAKRLEGKNLAEVYVNAGFGVAGSIDKLSLADFRRQMDTNIFGALQTVQATLPALRASHGKLVFIGSMNSYLSFPLGTPYSMSKFALRALAEGLYCELADVQVSIVCPGPVETEILQVNNQGVNLGETRINFGGQKPLSAELAAKRIASGVARGKREIFLSLDMQLLAWFHRHFPGIAIRVLRFLFQKKRAFFTKLVGKLNPDAV